MSVDILNEIGGMDVEETAPKPAQNSYKKFNGNGGFGKPKTNMYDAEFIKAEEIDCDKFSKVGKTFTVNLCGEEGDVEFDKAKELVIKIATKLSSLGYTFRTCFGSMDKVEKEICKIEGMKYEIYIPFKKFNVDFAEGAVISQYFEKPYKIAAGIVGKAFNERLLPKKGLRGIMASRIQSMLGKNCDNPSNILIIYTKDGREVMPDKTNTPYGKKPEKIDYAVLGNTPYFMKVAQKAGISVYNVHNTESVLSLKNTHLVKPVTETEDQI